MAEASISVDQLEFICSICLDLLKDPVTVACGHSFCLVCINVYWNADDQKGIYNCPQCRETFSPRPVLRRNNVMAEVVDKLKKTKFALPADCYAGRGDVKCDFCTNVKHKAIKSCLTCLASFCEIHLKPHYEVPSWKNHKLIKASSKLQEKVCSKHGKLMEIFCRTDQTCICYMCMIQQHKGHDTIATAEERGLKQSQINNVRTKGQEKIQENQKRLQDVKQAMDTLKSSAQAFVKDSERILNLLICSIKKSHSKLTELIQDQERAELSRAKRLQEQLERKIDDFKRRDTELAQLSQIQDHIDFLQSFQSLCDSTESDDSFSTSVNQNLSFDKMRKSLSDLKERLEGFYKEEIDKISPPAAAFEILLPSEPTTREDFLRYLRLLTLDPNTAYNRLVLSEENRAVTHSLIVQSFSDSPERFDYWDQVLCKESVSDCCYWEVEWSSKSWGVSISVSYGGISRKGRGNECKLGNNNQSWNLQCLPDFSFWHNDIKTPISGPPPSSRIGVYVDHSAGILSFYRVSDEMTLIHRVQTTFTQPLYAGFRVGWRSIVKLCDPIQM